MDSLLSDDDKKLLLELYGFAAETWKDYPLERLALPPGFPISPTDAVSLDEVWRTARRALYCESELGLIGGIEELRQQVEKLPGLEQNVTFAVFIRLLYHVVDEIGRAKMRDVFLLPL